MTKKPKKYTYDTVQISFFLPAKQRDLLLQISKEREITIAGLLRLLVKDFLKIDFKECNENEL